MTADLTLFSDEELAGSPSGGNAVRATGYGTHYMRLGGDRRRLTNCCDPLGAGLAAADAGVPGGRIDDGFAAGKPSRREKEIAAWLTADVPDDLLGAQFDIATLLAKIEEMRYLHTLATRNMLEAERRACEAEQRARETPAGQLASQLAMAHMAISRLHHEVSFQRAALDLCTREHLPVLRLLKAEQTPATAQAAPVEGTAPEAGEGN